MASTVLIFTEEGFKHIVNGLGELPAKLVHALLLDIDAQVSMVEKDVKGYLALIEQHLAPVKAKLDVIVAGEEAAAKAEAEQALALEAQSKVVADATPNE